MTSKYSQELYEDSEKLQWRGTPINDYVALKKRRKYTRHVIKRKRRKKIEKNETPN